MNRKLFAILLALMLFGVSFASYSQWDASLYVQPMPSPYVSDWENTPGIATFSISYNGTETKTVEISVELTGASRGWILNGVSDPKIFETGDVLSEGNTEFSDWSGSGDYEESIRDLIVRSGRFPEDIYTLIIEAKDISTGGVVIHREAVFTIMAPSYPSLIYPPDEDSLLMEYPNFQWTPVNAPPGYPVSYHLTLCEILPGQTKDQAIINYPTYGERMENQTSFLYTPQAPPLDTSKTYVWQVQAFGQAGNPLGENEGKSEVWSFSFKTLAIPEVEFEVTGLEVVLPDTIYGEQLIKAAIKVTIPEGASGTIEGTVSIDKTHWQDLEKYSSDTLVTIQTNPLPTESKDIGVHNLKVEIKKPNSKDTTLTYVVKEGGKIAGEAPDSLIIIPDLAYLTDISGTWEPVDDNNFNLSGTGKLRIKSLENNIVSVSINDLIITPNTAHPEYSVINSGSLSAEGNPLFELYNCLEIKRVDFNAPSTQLTIDAELSLPIQMDSPLLTLEDIIVTAEGIESKGFSTNQQFTLWGLIFAIQDIDNHDAIELGYGDEKFRVALSGKIKLDNREITQFSDFKFEYDINKQEFDLSGNFALLDPFRFIPDNEYVLLDTLTISTQSPQDWVLLTKGRINLPEPFDTLGARRFNLTINTDGDVTGGMDIIGPEVSGIDGDNTEFDFWITTFDLTYLGLQLNIRDGELKKDSCEVRLVADLYFPTTDDTTKISLGDVNPINPGITVDFDGNVDWKTMYLGNVLQGKNIDLEVLNCNIESFGIEANPFAFCLSGGFEVNLTGVNGSIGFANLLVNDNGFINLENCSGALNIKEIVNVSVDSIGFSESPTTLNLKKNTSSDEEMREGDGSIDSTGIEVDSYFQLNGSVSVGYNESTVFNGEFDRLLLFEKNSETNFFLNGVDADIGGSVKLHADIEYTGKLLRLAGSVELPNDIKGIAVGKIGKNNANEPTFGLFLAASGLDIPVVPPVYLTGVGGGFFYNPDPADIDIVKGMCGFSDDYKDNVNYNEIEPSPGNFAVLLYADMYVAEPELVRGNALMALTENYWSIDAEIEALEGTCWGYFGLEVSWNPAYLAGTFYTEVKFYGLIEGNGEGLIYVFGEDVWGVKLTGNVKIIPALDLPELGLDFFLGAPGFMLAAEFHAGFNIYVLSGGIDFESMFWYQRNVSWGAYASLYAHGEILGGLVGVSGGLEGAFIGSPDFLIYAVGHFSAEIFWVEVFNGSLWISAGSNGFDGGEGRNSKYDNLISSAKNMSSQMESKIDNLQGKMDEAFNSLADMSNEQIEAAGQQLINNLTGNIYVQFAFLALYTADYEYGPHYNPELESTLNDIISPATNSMKNGKDALSVEENNIADAIEALDGKTESVNGTLQQYENLLTGDLPSIQEIGVVNPVGAPTYETRTVDGEQLTFQTGFAFDESKANSNKENAEGTRDDITEYRNKLHEMVDQFTANVDMIDELLYSGNQAVFSLANDYTSGFEDLNDYYIHLFDYLENAKTLSENSIGVLTGTGEQAFEVYLSDQADELSLDELIYFVELRVALINALIPDPEDTVQSQPSSAWITELGERGAWRKFCVERGLDLWYRIPLAGFQSVIDNIGSIRSTAKGVFRTTRNNHADSWGDYTVELDGIYTRQSRLYEILYDLYDQLAHHAQTSGAASETGETEESTLTFGTIGIQDALISLPSATAAREYMNFQIAETEITVEGVVPEEGRWALQSYYADARDLVGSYLQVPVIESFTGNAQVRNDLGYSKVDFDFLASHPNGVIEYTYYFGSRYYYPEKFRSVGLKTNTHLTLLQNIDLSGTYWTAIRARGRGGYNIFRKQGNISIEWGQDAESQYDSPMELPDDNTPPSTPVVEDKGDFSTSNNMLYGNWESRDMESGIQEYQYAIGILNENLQQFEPTVRDFTSAGGMMELNIRDISLEDSLTYYIAVKAKNGEGNWSGTGYSDGIVVDGSPPTKPEIDAFDKGAAGEDYLSLYGNWAPSSDPHSGISHYTYCVGTTPGSDNRIHSRQTSDTQFSKHVGDALNTGTYYLTVKAVNKAGISSESSASLEVVIDDTPPSGPFIFLFNIEEPPGGAGQCNITARFTASDPESGIAHLGCSIDFGEGLSQILTSMSLIDIDQINEDTYEANGSIFIKNSYNFEPESWELRVTVTNGAGLESERVRRLRRNLIELQEEIEELE